jgi:hypothetical protein
MGADILLAILAALADMILTIELFTDTAGYGMILTYPFVTITAPGTMGDATGRYPRISSFGLFLTRLEVILCLIRKKPCLCFWDSPFLPPFDVFPCKLNPEICLFRSLLEAEKRVPWGLGWGKGKEGLF